MIISLDLNKDTRSENLAYSFHRLGIVDSIAAICSAVPPTALINGSKPLDAI